LGGQDGREGSEVNLASHLLRDAFSKKFEVAVLITDDSDLAEPEFGSSPTNSDPRILNPHQFHSRELRQYVSVRFSPHRQMA
jgi:hypothetical protein